MKNRLSEKNARPQKLKMTEKMTEKQQNVGAIPRGRPKTLMQNRKDVTFCVSYFIAYLRNLRLFCLRGFACVILSNVLSLSKGCICPANHAKINF